MPKKGFEKEKIVKMTQELEKIFSDLKKCIKGCRGKFAFGSAMRSLCIIKCKIAKVNNEIKWIQKWAERKDVKIAVTKKKIELLKLERKMKEVQERLINKSRKSKPAK